MISKHDNSKLISPKNYPIDFGRVNDCILKVNVKYKTINFRKQVFDSKYANNAASHIYDTSKWLF